MLQAQYNFPYATPGTGGSQIPAYPVRAACQLLANSNLTDTALFNAMAQALPIFKGNVSTACIDTTGHGQLGTDPFSYQVGLLRLLLLVSEQVKHVPA